MMRYEKFERRWKRAKFIRDTLHNARFWIAGTLCVAGATTGTILASEGKVSTPEGVPTTIVYGENVAAKVSASMGKAADVVYSKDGTGIWTSETPKLVGSYKAKGVSTNGFGAKTESEEISFSITPKPITVAITSDAIVYGSNSFNYTCSPLAYNDELANISTILENFDSSNLTADAKLDTDIYAGSVNVTYCYSFSQAAKKVSVTKKDLLVSFSNEEKEYDGTALTASYEVKTPTTLASGDSIESTNESSITDKGEVASTADIKIKNIDGSDRTAFYNITKNPGNLRITPRNITVSTSNISRDYNGTKISKDELLAGTTISAGSLLEGHKITYSHYDAEGAYICVDGMDNKVEATITDENGNNVSDYYNVNFNYGEVKISKKAIKYASVSQTKVYDGASLSANEIINVENLKSQLADNDEIKSTTSTVVEGNNVGESVENHVQLVIFNSELNQNVQDCYLINETKGSLMITKRNLFVNMPVVNDVYSSLPFELSGSENIHADSTKGDGLSDGAYLELNVDPDKVYTMTDAGTYDVTANGDEASYSVLVKNSVGDDITNFYNITPIWTNSTIAKRDIGFSTKDILFNFDFGNGYTNDADATADVEVYEGSLGSNDMISANVTNNKTVLEVGTHENIIEFGVYNKSDAAKNDNIRFKNYSEALHPLKAGEATVDKTTIKVYAKNAEKYYDGLPYSSETAWGFTNEGLLHKNGYQIIGLTAYSDQINVTDTTNAPIKFSGTAKPATYPGGVALSGDALTEFNKRFNIDVQPESGFLNIFKRLVTIRDAEDGFDYDGNYHRTPDNAVQFQWSPEEVSGWEYEIKGLDEEYKGVRNFDDVASANITGETGDAYVQFKFLNKDKELFNVDKSNLTINYMTAAATGASLNPVKKRNITIKTANLTEAVFDNTPKSNVALETGYNQYLANGEYITSESIKAAFGTPTTITNVGVADNTPTFDATKLKVKDSRTGYATYEKSLSTNYNVTVSLGQLTVQKAHIYVQLQKATKIYYGQLFGMKLGETFEISTDSGNNGAQIVTDYSNGTTPQNYHAYAIPNADGKTFSLDLYNGEKLSSNKVTLVKKTTINDSIKFDFGNVEYVLNGEVETSFTQRCLTISTIATQSVKYGQTATSIDEKRVLDDSLASGDYLFFEYTDAQSGTTAYEPWVKEQTDYKDFDYYSTDHAKGSKTSLEFGEPKIFKKVSELDINKDNYQSYIDEGYILAYNTGTNQVTTKISFDLNDGNGTQKYIDVTKWYDIKRSYGTIVCK